MRGLLLLLLGLTCCHAAIILETYKSLRLFLTESLDVNKKNQAVAEQSLHQLLMASTNSTSAEIAAVEITENGKVINIYGKESALFKVASQLASGQLVLSATGQAAQITESQVLPCDQFSQLYMEYEKIKMKKKETEAYVKNMRTQIASHLGIEDRMVQSVIMTSSKCTIVMQREARALLVKSIQKNEFHASDVYGAPLIITMIEASEVTESTHSSLAKQTKYILDNKAEESVVKQSQKEIKNEAKLLKSQSKSDLKAVKKYGYVHYIQEASYQTPKAAQEFRAHCAAYTFETPLAYEMEALNGALSKSEEITTKYATIRFELLELQTVNKTKNELKKEETHIHESVVEESGLKSNEVFVTLSGSTLTITGHTQTILELKETLTTGPLSKVSWTDGTNIVAQDMKVVAASDYQAVVLFVTGILLPKQRIEGELVSLRESIAATTSLTEADVPELRLSDDQLEVTVMTNRQKVTELLEAIYARDIDLYLSNGKYVTIMDVILTEVEADFVPKPNKAPPKPADRSSSGSGKNNKSQTPRPTTPRPVTEPPAVQEIKELPKNCEEACAGLGPGERAANPGVCDAYCLCGGAPTPAWCPFQKYYDAGSGSCVPVIPGVSECIPSV